MREDLIRRLLGSFDVSKYIEKARVRGRANADPDERRIAASLYEEIAGFRSREIDVSYELDLALELAERTLFAEWHSLHNNNVPRYASYTNLKVLNWSLRVNRRTSLSEIWPRCRRMVGLLVQDLTSFEVWSLAGFEQSQQKDLNPEAVRERINLLQALHSQVTNSTKIFSRQPISEAPTDWFSFALDPSREAALLHLTVFPQTDQHDEVLFLRTIHISECIFWGVLTAVEAAIEMLKQGSMEAAAIYLVQANWFAKLLLPLFQAFKTMPVEHFRNFREQTGNASAVQSRTYQLMQITCQGVDEKKIEVLSKTPEVSDLLLCAHPSFLSLSNLLINLEEDGADGLEEVRTQAQALDRHLYTWRRLHLGIAREYLADLMCPSMLGTVGVTAGLSNSSAGAVSGVIPVGTGGTSGPPYLAAHYRHMIIKRPSHHPLWAMVELTPQMVARPLLGWMN
jgi:tryptophan 2,3-dioxygenase